MQPPPQLTHEEYLNKIALNQSNDYIFIVLYACSNITPDL